VEVESEEAAAAEQPIAVYLAAADPAAGEAAFKKCAVCHTAAKGGPNLAGPNLWGIVGAPHGHVAGFAYSDALKSKPGNWDWEAMSAWLKSPKTYAPGTKMTFAGLSKPEERANLIAWLNTQSDSPQPIPAAPAAAGAPDDAAASANASAVAEKEPVLNEAQAATSKEFVGGEGAPTVSGAKAQEKH
jgi:cytochrome c